MALPIWCALLVVLAGLLAEGDFRNCHTVLLITLDSTRDTTFCSGTLLERPGYTQARSLRQKKSLK